MDRQPQDTRLAAAPGPGASGSPPLREFQPATTASVAEPSVDAPTLEAPWSAFIARILRPANTDTPRGSKG